MTDEAYDVGDPKRSDWRGVATPDPVTEWLQDFLADGYRVVSVSDVCDCCGAFLPRHYLGCLEAKDE